MQAKMNEWVQYVLVIGLIAMLVGSFTWMKPVTPTIPTADEIAEKIVIPEVGNYDEILAKICESDKVDCYGTYVSKNDQKKIGKTVFTNQLALNNVTGDNETFEDLLELLDLDETYFINIYTRDQGEYKATVANREARDDGDYSVSQLIRVKWVDVDYPDNTETAYYLVNSEVEGYDFETQTYDDFNLVSVEKTTRDFKF